MTQDEIIELARQAGLMADGEMWFSPTYGSGDVHISHLETFVKLVAEKEREACWQIACDYTQKFNSHTCLAVADEIRARK